ncbi:MAG: hypothetical protein IJ496_01870 [Ruminococcus sp.]|nr:hypothetical protein [Ruminococcus sp.]
MELYKMLTKKYTSTGEEVQSGKLKIKFRSFKILHLQIMGKENSIGFHANYKTATFVMDNFAVFAEAAMNFLVQKNILKPTSVMDQEMGITFDAFHMGYEGLVADFVFCLEEKSIRFTGISKKMHYVYANLGRDASGFISYEHPTLKLAYRAGD